MFNKTSQTTEADLRESYRQRLNEILGSPARARQAGVAVVEVPAPAPECIASAEPEPPAPVSFVEAAPPTVPTQEATTDDVFGRAAQNLARSLTQCWLGTMQEVQRLRSLDHAKLEASVTDLKSVRGEVQALQQAVAALGGMIREQAEQAETLQQTVKNRQQQLDTQAASALAQVTQRLDTQADVIRNLRAALESESQRREQFRSTLEQLREAVSGTPLPVALPENL
jgi:hypothetical protein